MLDNGPWAFDNNLLVLRRWEQGMSVFSRTLTHTQFWVQVWGLPFDLITPKIGTLVGNSMGRYLLVDGRTEQSKQAQFLRVKVEFPLHKPLHRGGVILPVQRESDTGRTIDMSVFCFSVSGVASLDMKLGIVHHSQRIWVNMGYGSEPVVLVRKCTLQTTLPHSHPQRECRRPG